MGQTTPVDAALAAIVELLVSRWPAEKIVLFGSRACGTHDADSDVDLLIIVPDASYYPGLAIEIRRSLRGIPIAVDLVVAKRSTIERQSGIAGTIYFEALQDGITLYAAA